MAELWKHAAHMRTEPAAPNHLAEWLKMRAELWPDASAAEHLGDIEALIARGEQAISLIAIVGSAEVAGFAEAALRQDPVNGCSGSPTAFLEGLYVRAPHRRSGAATVLLAGVESWARGLGHSELASDTAWENAAGLAFHAAHGFTETERVVFFRKAL